MKWFKHTVTAITLISLVVMLYSFISVDEIETGIIHSSLFAVYTTFTFLTILTYRISLIGRRRIKWASFGLGILILISLFSMNLDKELVYSLWDFTMVGFIFLVGEAILQIIPKKKPLTWLTKASTAVLLIFLIVIIMFQLGSPLVHYITGWLVVLFSLLLIVNFFLKTKKA